jgi:hypothetical protein
MTTTNRDGFVVKTFDGEEVAFIACTSNHDSVRERTMLGLLRNMRDDCFVVDTRDTEESA